jgi:hypothetical protein
MTEENGQDAAPDNVVALMPWDITVRSAVERREAYALLERQDADQAIRGLTELETYYAVKALGSDDATPFLAVITPEQTLALFDLDVWHDDKVDLDDTLVWLGAFREVSPERMVAAARALDPELLALLFRRRLMIARMRPDDTGEDRPAWVDDPPDEILPLVETPDRRFIVAARATDELDEIEGRRAAIDDEERKAVLQLVDDLYRDTDFETAAGVMRMAETDMSSDLEETALRFRSARLEDLGFPPFERALEIYGRVDPIRVLASSQNRSGRGELRLPAIHASRLSEGLLRAGLRELRDPELVHAIEGELVPLANAALVAEHVEPGDLDRLGEVLDRVRAYLELALAYGGEGDPAQIAAERLSRLPLRTIFAAGWSITFELGARARRLVQRGVFRVRDQNLGLLEERDRMVLEALILRRPMYSTILERERPAASRSIRSPADVERIESALLELESLADAASAYDLARSNLSLEGRLEPPEPSERSVDMLLTTIAASALLGRGPQLLPLDQNALLELAQRVKEASFPEDQLEAAIVRLATPLGGVTSAPYAERVRKGLRALAEALAPFQGRDDLDPRFVGEVVRRLR